MSSRGRLRRIRVALLAAALATLALMYAPQPVLPQLADHFRLTPAEASLTISATTAGLALAGIPLAAVAQAVGRRRLMVGAMIAATVIGLVLPLVSSLTGLVALRAVQGMAIAGVPSVAMAYVADELDPTEVGPSMGVYVAGTSIGGLAGRLVAGIGGDVAGWHAGLFAVGVFAALATVAFVVLLPAPRREVRTGAQWRPLVRGMRDAVRDPVLYGPYVVAAFGMGSFVAVYNVLSFRLVGPPFHLAPALATLVFLAYLAGSVTSATAGWATVRLGRPAVLLAALAVAVAGIALSIPANLALVIVGLVVFTGGFFGAHSVASGWVGVRATPLARGQASAVYLLAYYVGSSIGGTTGSLAYGTAGWPAFVGLVCCWLAVAMAATVAAWLLERRRR